MTRKVVGRSDGRTVGGIAESTRLLTARPPERQTAVDWYLIVDPVGRSGAENMAIDYSLLRNAQQGVAFLRLYRWMPPCLSFGRNEPARTRYDTDAIARLGLDTVRRPTGGRAVWHDREVTYAVAGPTNMFGSLREAYIRIHGVLAAALRRLGVPAELAPHPRTRAITPDGGACFASPAGGEIVVGGLKLVGSAQVREASALLQHGSILVENGQDVVARITRGRRRSPAATSLTAALRRSVSLEEVSDAIVAEARQYWKGAWQDGMACCTADAIARFQDPAWTWRR
ncbi:MAG: hypothetical protein GTN62_13895 [Gemmatimonadales bacterium]|nr:hypothetical protein [Gemmatimonadales bacterium]NIN13096.1 hypothetical protein [Gemmatimonadales bacterium]NIN51180.1 hypothetical protein [Gemmatimonadales bacterium]NIP08644.1 hypothetical protein [Gemmatimonadales bacterium]NIR02332.1 hypothetical protein [Gemmatimonadales bacterium]